jgi:beta-glucosidase
MKKIAFIFLCIPFILNAQNKFNAIDIAENVKGIKVNNQITLGYSTHSGVQIIYQDGLPFKDLNKNGKLDAYEDWRLNVNDRAKDLASKMTIQQIAGLMLYSAHQGVPSAEQGMFAGTYNGKPFSQSGAKPYDLNDQQIDFLKNDNLRHVLITTVESPVVAATLSNNGEYKPVSKPAN